MFQNGRAVFRVFGKEPCHYFHRLAARWMPKISFQSTADLPRVYFHSGVQACTLDKDVKDKSFIIKTASASKIENTGDFQDRTLDLGGLSDAGTVIPCQETMAMLIGGVRYDELPVVHIKSSPNNTIIHVTDHTGQKFIARSSCGQEGFKNVKKSTNVASQATGLSVGLKVMKMGLLNMRVVVKGLGAGRLASIKGLQMAGLNVVSISDDTHVPRDGPRPRKARRL